jgi:hypothetical protein
LKARTAFTTLCFDTNAFACFKQQQQQQQQQQQRQKRNDSDKKKKNNAFRIQNDKRTKKNTQLLPQHNTTRGRPIFPTILLHLLDTVDPEVVF